MVLGKFMGNGSFKAESIHSKVFQAVSCGPISGSLVLWVGASS